ncbi:MEDS domain-containing protein [Streptomyces sp. V4-01]|uniref:MEDS domain-containing protein n=1 Tax=Actinacidiphila polyblastidii TaxID=3110430 RepID=A0ABU7P3M0_9ACTN|nr:MEDS domain-containing protein [Streptomyces sp. V4-01]
MASLAPVGVGDHVCWAVPAKADFQRAALAYLTDGTRLGDKIMVVGSPSRSWRLDLRGPQGVLVDPSACDVDWDANALVSLLRQEAEEAGRQGFRALRVLAHMDHFWPAGLTPRQVADHELRLDAVIGASAAMVVCAYAGSGFLPDVLGQAATVHPHFAGDRDAAPSFQVFSAGEDCWNVSGVVDADGAPAFHTAVTELLRTTDTLRLRCQGLELMDAAGMQALVEASGAHPGRTIMVEDANPLVRKCWELLGYDSPAVPVELVP